MKRRRQRQGKCTGASRCEVVSHALKGFSTSPGGIKPVAGKYTVGAVESQVWVQGAAGTEVWLGVKLAGSKGSKIGWIFSGKLQRLVGEDRRWWDRPVERKGQGRVDGAMAQVGGK